MKVTIMQPAYIPWLGFFDRIDASDLLVVLDNVQLDTNSQTRFTNRNKIRTKDGWTWLTLPLKMKGLHGQALINEIQLVNDNWRKKHKKSIQMNYQKSPFFKDYSDEFLSFYTQEWSLMQDLLDEGLSFFLRTLGIKTPIIKASTLNVSGKKDDLILNICKDLGASEYYSGVFGRDYLKMDAFNKKNIELFFHEYQHPNYKQVYDGFEPYMGVIDLLFNEGERSLEVIRKGRSFSN